MGRPSNYDATLSHYAGQPAYASHQNIHLLNADVAYSRGIAVPVQGGLSHEDTWGIFALTRSQHTYKCWHPPIWWEGREAYLYLYMICVDHDIPSSPNYQILLSCTIMNLSRDADESGEYVSQSWTVVKGDLAESCGVKDPASPAEYAQMRPLRAQGNIIRMAITSGPIPSMGIDPGHPLYVVTDIAGDGPDVGEYVYLTLPTVYIVPAYPTGR